MEIMRRGRRPSLDGCRRQTSGKTANKSATMTSLSSTSAKPGVGEATAVSGVFDVHPCAAFAPISEANLENMGAITTAQQPNAASLPTGERASVG